jgi:hypothetical protein
MNESNYAKLIDLFDKLLTLNENDQTSQLQTKNLIKKNVSAYKQSIIAGKIKPPSELGRRVVLALGSNIAEYKVDRKVIDAAYTIDKYFETL